MFANPYMLIGLGVAVLPIVIHLLSRSRYRTVDWGAMMFLEGAATQAQSRSRPTQFLLLLIRTAIVALLALALARPELPDRFSRGSANADRHGSAVILLDCSASMGFEENGRPRMELAREAAQQLLSLHRGDRVSLVLMGQNQPRAERTPTADLWQVGSRIQSAEIGYGRSEISRALDDAIDVLEPRDPPALGQLVTFYVVTDRQAANWKEILDGGDEWAAQWRQKASRVSGVARIVVIPVGSPESENLVVRSIEPVSSAVVAGQPLDLEVKIQNIGPVQWASLPLLLKVDGSQAGPEQRINLAPDSTAVVRFSLASGISEAGTHVISAEVGRPGALPTGGAAAVAAARTRAGGLAGDDRLDVVLDVQEPTHVLIVRGDEPPAATGSTSPAMSGTQYLAAALAPFKAARKRPADPFIVDVVSAEQWTGTTVDPKPQRPGKKPDAVSSDLATKLSSYQVIVLSNVEQIDESQLAALEQFVAEGGGLLLAPGELTRIDELDKSLYRDGAGLLPAALGPPTAADLSEQTTLGVADSSHPALRFLASQSEAIGTIAVGRYFPTSRIAPSARVLVRYATGEPFLLEMPPSGTRRGKVLLMTSSFDPGWTTLARTNLIVPLAQAATRYLGESPPRKLNLAPGDPIDVPLDDVGEMRTVRIRPPGSTEARSLELQRSGNDLAVHYTETETPGIYAIQVAEPGRKTQVIHVVVTPSRDESNLAPLAAADWKRLERLANVQKLDPSVEPISSAAALPAPLEIWPYALGAVFLLGILEMKLSPRLKEPEE
jgi:hypothetical protein